MTNTAPAAPIADAHVEAYVTELMAAGAPSVFVGHEDIGGDEFAVFRLAFEL